MDDRPVVGELQGGRHRFAILHGDGLDEGFDRRGRRIEIEILLIDAEDREAEGDALVVANGDAGQGRFAGADDVEPGGHEVGDVAQRRHRVATVGVVGEHGLGALGARRCDDPVVAAGGGAQLGLRGPLVQVRLEAHGRRGQEVVLQHIGGNGAGVQAIRHLERPIRAQRPPQRRLGETHLAHQARPRDFRDDVAPQAVAADAHHVFRPPAFRQITEQGELHWQQRRFRARERHEGVDAGNERRGDALGVAAVREPLAVHVAAIEEEAVGAVLRHVIRAEHRGEPP